MPAKLCVAGTNHEARVPVGTTIAEISGLPLSRVPVRAVIVQTAGDVGAGIGDELLAAVDHPFMITQGGARPGGTGVRSGFGFGEPEGGQRATGKQIRQPARLLLRRAEVSDRVDAQPQQPPE